MSRKVAPRNVNYSLKTFQNVVNISTRRTYCDEDTMRKRGIAAENVYNRKKSSEQLKELRRIREEQIAEKIKSEMKRIRKETMKDIEFYNNDNKKKSK